MQSSLTSVGKIISHPEMPSLVIDRVLGRYDRFVAAFHVCR